MRFAVKPFYSALFTLLFLCVWTPDAFAQADSTYNPKEEIVFRDKRYRIWNNWMSGGFGPAFHTNNPHTQVVLGVNFNFHIRTHYFRLGGALSGDQFWRNWNNYNLHGAYIFRRKENERWHKAFMAGLSYSTGYYFLYPPGVYELEPYNHPGLYFEAQFIRKVEYDYGVGLTWFADVNKKQTITGLKVDIFFSGAYRGYVKGKAPKKMIPN